MALKSNAMASRINNNVNQGKRNRKQLFNDSIEYINEKDNNVVPIEEIAAEQPKTKKKTKKASE